MICNHCGYQANEDFAFCPNCGKSVNEGQQPAGESNAQQPEQQVFQEAPVQTDFATQKALSLFKDSLFLVICILQSVATGLSLIGKSFPIIGILFTVFLWLIYSQSRKNIVSAKYMRYVSGTNFAVYVLGWVASIALVVGGILLALLFAVIGSDSSVVDFFMNELRSIVGSYAGILVRLLYGAAVWFTIICVVAAAIVMLITYFGYRSIHKFSQSLYRSIECKDLIIVKRNTAQVWLLIFGIFSAISALGSVFGANMTGFISNGCTAGVYILSYLLINKYYSDCNS